jgi:hypothetical protein
MRTFHFTTVVSIGYLYKFLAMQESLNNHCKDYSLFALCVDREVYKVLKRLPLKNTLLLKASDFEKDALAVAKSNRNYHEYCWTLKPFILNYVMKTYRDAQYFAHIDSDLFFYSNPEQIIKENREAALFLTDHNNSEHFMHCYESSGIYNTGFVCCKNDSSAYSAAQWWLDKCIENCSLIANVEEGLYGDQKYVEKWPSLFSNVHVVQSKGANVAQWNIEGFGISERAGSVYVNDDKLIFYHFSGLSILSNYEFNLSTFYKIEDSPLKLIYMPYIQNLVKQIKTVNNMFPGFEGSFTDRRFVNFIHPIKMNK